MRSDVTQRARLSRHPQSIASPELEIEVEVRRDASVLTLMYVARGDIEVVWLPKITEPARRDGLWQRTCFEAFVGSGHSTSYWEFNLSPSREWAAYRFDGYRHGMAAEPSINDPKIELQRDDSEVRLLATLHLFGIAGLSGRDDWRLGLSAVIEDKNGDKSWWALAHPPGKPDFHHAESFALKLLDQRSNFASSAQPPRPPR